MNCQQKIISTQDVWTTPAGSTRAVLQCTEKMKALTDRMETVSFRPVKKHLSSKESLYSKGYNGCKQTTSQCPYLWDSHGCTLFSLRRGNDTSLSPATGAVGVGSLCPRPAPAQRAQRRPAKIILKVEIGCLHLYTNEAHNLFEVRLGVRRLRRHLWYM